MRDVFQVRLSVRQGGEEEASGGRSLAPSTTTSADALWLAWVRTNPLLERPLHLALELLEDATRPDSPLREQAFPIAAEVASQIYNRYCTSTEPTAMSYRITAARLLARCARVNLALAEPRLRAEAERHHHRVGLWIALGNRRHHRGVTCARCGRDACLLCIRGARSKSHSHGPSFSADEYLCKPGL